MWRILELITFTRFCWYCLKMRCEIQQEQLATQHKVCPPREVQTNALETVIHSLFLALYDERKDVDAPSLAHGQSSSTPDDRRQSVMAAFKFFIFTLASLPFSIAQIHSILATTSSLAGRSPPKEPSPVIFYHDSTAKAQSRLVRRTNGDGETGGSRRRPRRGSEPGPGRPLRRQRTGLEGPSDNPNSGFGPPRPQHVRGFPLDEPRPSQLPLGGPQTLPGEHNNLVEGGQRLQLLRGMSGHDFPSRARDEIMLRTLIGKRIDIYWRIAVEESHGPVAQLMEGAKSLFDEEWVPDAGTRHQTRIAMVSVKEGGCKALKQNEYVRRVYTSSESHGFGHVSCTQSSVSKSSTWKI